ncbi:MAG: DUF4040 domain-containing protein [Thiohalocapsa sp. PB-PSB1]|jgi:energy-converting hydrogenase B subunit D|nr:MAG: hypothetical protein N838_02025 [Thiohalocapsa sp. PB-PSB1]QQO53628.1 MAG: DUF4040 domain-containing protein [Thiohalocapsa sp. PB-PSB1]
MQADVVTWFALLVVVMILVSAVLVLTLPNMIGAVAVSGVVSLGVAVLFVLLHAPDVAMTEAAVGTGLSGVVLALGLRRLGLWRLERTADDAQPAPLISPQTSPQTSPPTSPAQQNPDRRKPMDNQGGKQDA